MSQQGQSNEENEGGKGSEETTVAPTTPAAEDNKTDGNADTVQKVSKLWGFGIHQIK